MTEIIKPNLVIIEGVINNPQHLFENLLANVQWDERIKARKTASFGVPYDYSGMTYPQCEMLPILKSACDSIRQALGYEANNCLLNYYPDGNSSMGYHSDSSEELFEGTGVAIISVGAERQINYKNKADKSIIHRYSLKPGTLLYMDKQVQDDWLHAIPKQKDVGERISLTFRHIINA